MGGPLMTMKTVEHTWESALPRERGLREGFETLGDAELVAVLLGTGEKGRPVAHVAVDLLEQAGGLAGRARPGPDALTEPRGGGAAKAPRGGAALRASQRAVPSGGGGSGR